MLVNKTFCPQIDKFIRIIGYLSRRYELSSKRFHVYCLYPDHNVGLNEVMQFRRATQTLSHVSRITSQAMSFQTRTLHCV